MLSTHRLLVLAELAQRGTITAVAEALHYTPSTVSHQLATLEREVGVALVERTARSVRLTSAGVALAERARGILDDLRVAEADTRAIAGLGGGTLRLAMFPSAGVAFLPRLLEALHGAHPDLEVAVVEAEPEEALPLVRHGAVDVALVYDEFPYTPVEDDVVECAVVHADEILVCVPHAHPAVARGSVALADLRDERFVAGPDDSGCHAYLVSVCEAAGFSPVITARAADMTMTARLIESGGEVSLRPRLMVEAAGTTLPALPFEPAVPDRLVLAAHRRAARHLPVVRAALAAVAEATRAHGEDLALLR